MRSSTGKRAVLRDAARGLRLAIVAALLFAMPAARAAGEWLEVDYSSLLDRRQVSHSGETVGMLLDRLAGRPAPAPGERPADRAAHALLEPLVEGYGFVVSDTLDLLEGVASSPLVEVAGLWRPGAAQPAWAELLRARRLVVESDGSGTLRVALPATDTASATPAADAWAAAWPVLRHVLAAEKRRLERAAFAAPNPAPVKLDVRAYAYRHLPARSLFELYTEPYATTVDDTRADGLRPPLDLVAWESFLADGLQLEGARIDADGSVRLFGSKTDSAPTLAGSPIGLADLAVAYRAVFHGGLAEPYMSLDRGYSPQTALVNYGGRLRDTALGLVSLLCDIRFKTFSMGIDIASGRDVRHEIREQIPAFRSHMEHFAEHPRSVDVVNQQTRLWFYPDRVDLTVSAQGDALVMRRVRMSAASERLTEDAGTAAGEQAPWTIATVAAINEDYDALATFFPELTELDHVVRLLSLFTWLRQAEANGLLVPDLDALLAVELPAVPTPRTFPQLLAFNALPQPGTGAEAIVFDRVPVAEALERLNPPEGPLAPMVRLARAALALDPRDPAAKAQLDELRTTDLSRLDAATIDQLAFRAERLRMHNTVLSTLPQREVEAVTSRQDAGETLRVFSVGIGGLDLGMGKVVARAGSRTLSLTGLPTPNAAGSVAAADLPPLPTEPRESWRVDAPIVETTTLPRHESPTGTQRLRFGDGWVESRRDGETEIVWTVLGAHAVDVRSREVTLGDGRRPVAIVRVEGALRLRYRLERAGTTVRCVRDTTPEPAVPPAQRTTRPTPETLVTLAVAPASDPAPSPISGEPQKLALRIQASSGGTPRLLEADFPRAVLQRLAAGKAADLTPGRPLPALEPLPPALGTVETLMLLMSPQALAHPWEPGYVRLAGEEDPQRLARSLAEWWDGTSGSPSVVVGIDEAQSTMRWAFATSLPVAPGVLVLPRNTFHGHLTDLEGRLQNMWSGPVYDRMPIATDAPLVLIVTGEEPGVLAGLLAEIATRPAMKDKFLAVWSLAGPLRRDVPAWILENGTIAGLGIAETSVVGQRDVQAALEAFQGGLTAERVRVEQLAGPFLWYF